MITMTSNTGKPIILKVVLLGDNFVGKTSLASRFVSNTFSYAPDATIGVSFGKKTVEVGEVEICFHVWDTAGNERYNDLSQQYLKEAHVAVLVYSLEEPSSFDNIRWWMDTIQKGENVPNIVIVGNKRDLTPEYDDTVPLEFASKHGALYTTVASKTGQNVDALFNTMAITVLRDLKRKASEKT